MSEVVQPPKQLLPNGWARPEDPPTAFGEYNTLHYVVVLVYNKERKSFFQTVSEYLPRSGFWGYDVASNRETVVVAWRPFPNATEAAQILRAELIPLEEKSDG